MKLLLLAGVLWLGGAEVGCILSKGGEGEEAKASDSAAEQSIKRDYSYEEAGYGHGGYGLSAHYGFPEGQEGFGALEGGKQYIHYPEEHHHHHQEHHHKPYDVGYHKALAIKSLLVPLAGVALLGAAAAFVSNPILLQLGVISSSSLGRRKREAAGELRDARLPVRLMGQMPEQKIRSQERRLVAKYLSCSGIAKNLCLERLACELHSADGATMAAEANVLTMALGQILDNEFVPEDTKNRLRKAIDSGRKSSSCGIFRCEEMDAQGASQ